MLGQRSDKNLSVHKLCSQSSQAGELTWTVGVPWSCGSWRRTSLPACPSCASIPAQSLLCGGRTPAGPAAAGYETPTAAPSIWTVQPAGCGSLSIRRAHKNGTSQMFILLTQHALVGNVLERSRIAFLQFTTSLCHIIRNMFFSIRIEPSHTHIMKGKLMNSCYSVHKLSVKVPYYTMCSFCSYNNMRLYFVNKLPRNEESPSFTCFASSTLQKVWAKALSS